MPLSKVNFENQSEHTQQYNQSIAGGDPGIYNRSVLGEKITFHIFDDKWTSTTREGTVYCPCCSNICTAQFYHTSIVIVKGQLYIIWVVCAFGGFYSKLIPIKFILQQYEHYDSDW